MCTLLCGQGDYIILQMLNIIYQKWVNVATFSGCSINEEKNVLSHQLSLGILLPTFQLIHILIFKMDTEICTDCMACLFLCMLELTVFLLCRQTVVCTCHFVLKSDWYCQIQVPQVDNFPYKCYHTLFPPSFCGERLVMIEYFFPLLL